MGMRSQMWKDLCRTWKKHTGTQLATLSVLVAAFTIITLLLTLSLNTQRVLASWGDSVGMTVYLEDSMSQEQVSKLKTQLQEMHELESVEFFSKEKTKKDLQSELSQVLSGLESENLFPASFLLKFKGNHSEESSIIEQTGRNIAAFTGVEDVSYGQDWVRNYQSFIVNVYQLGAVFIIALLLGGAFVIGNSLRIAIVQRRDEIEILELVGATYQMIRRPYLFQGLFMGFWAGAFSLAISYAVYQLGVQAMREQLEFFAISSQIKFLPLTWMLVVLIAAMFLGFIGSYLTVRSLNHGWAASQRVQS